MRRSSLFPAVCFVPVLLALPGCATATGEGWTLVWADEFEGSPGHPPDPVRWTHDVGTDWGNQQLEFDTDRTANAALDGEGRLAIVARQEEYRGRAYTSARITTAGRFETTYGRFEARIRLPTGQGIWPAFWLLGANIDEVGWPQCGEIDVMEYRGQEPRLVLGTVHGPGYFAAEGVTRNFALEEGRFDEAFHTFAIEWDEDAIRWFVDGEPYHSVTKRDLPGPWVFDHPFYLILNVAVGGHFVGPPDETTSFPQRMLVDWVRVYQRG